MFPADPCGIPDEELGDQGDGGEYEHENSGDCDEPDREVSPPHPEQDDEKGESAETILKAIRKVHEGEIWLDRTATGRIFLELSRNKANEALNPEQKKIASLTPRERQIVAEIGSDAAAGSKQIAERLHISEHTLRNHIASIYEKLEVSSRLELFAYAGKHRILPAT